MLLFAAFSMRRTLPFFVVAFLATILPKSAEAADDAAVARADALFQEGRAAVRAGDWERGCPKFEESLRLDPAPGTRINLGECEERTGHLVRAFELYETALRELPADDARTPVAKQRAEAVDARIPHLVVTGSGHVRVDGNDVTRGADTRLDAGRHTVVAGGRTTTITLVEKERRTFDPDASAPALVATVAPEPTSSSQSTIGLAIGGLGLAAIASGLVVGGLTIHQKNLVDSHCDASNACDQTGLDAKSEGRTLSTVSTIAVGAGVVALAAGIVLFVTSPKSASSTTAAMEVLRGRF